MRRNLDDYDMYVEMEEDIPCDCCTYITVQGCKMDVLRLCRHLKYEEDRIKESMASPGNLDYLHTYPLSLNALVKELDIQLESQIPCGLLFYCGEVQENKNGIFEFRFEIDSDQPCHELMDKIARKFHLDLYYYFGQASTEYFETNDWEGRAYYGDYVVFNSDSLCDFTGFGWVEDYMKHFFESDDGDNYNGENYFEALMEARYSDHYKIGDEEDYCHVYHLKALDPEKKRGHDMQYSRIPQDPYEDAYEMECLVHGYRNQVEDFFSKISFGMEKWGELSLDLLAEWYDLETYEVDLCFPVEGRITFCEERVSDMHDSFTFVVTSNLPPVTFLERLSEKNGFDIITVGVYEMKSGRLNRTPYDDPAKNAEIRRAFSRFRFLKGAEVPHGSYLDAKYILSQYAEFDWDMIKGLKNWERYCIIRENGMETGVKEEMPHEVMEGIEKVCVVMCRNAE